MDHLQLHDLESASVPRRANVSGFSLVELMIAMMLGLIVIAGLTQLYLGGRDANRIIENTTYLNDNGRFAMEFFARDLRMAGYFSCGGRLAQIANAIDITNGTTAQRFAMNLASGEKLPVGIEGFEGGADTLPSPISGFGVVSDTDVFVIRYADVRNSIKVETGDLDTSQQRFTFDRAHYLNPGDFLAMNKSNCDQTTLFQVTSAQDNDGSHFIGYGDNASVSPGNCSTDLAGNYECSDTSGATALSSSEAVGSVIAKFVARSYFIANDPGNCSDVPADCSKLAQCPTLFVAGTNTVAPILRGVTDMQLEYGIDDGITLDGGRVVSAGDGVDKYFTANAISDVAWRQVVSFRITVTLVSKQCKDESFTTTVALRNAGITVGAY